MNSGPLSTHPFNSFNPFAQTQGGYPRQTRSCDGTCLTYNGNASNDCLTCPSSYSLQVQSFENITGYIQVNLSSNGSFFGMAFSLSLLTFRMLFMLVSITIAVHSILPQIMVTIQFIHLRVLIQEAVFLIVTLVLPVTTLLICQPQTTHHLILPHRVSEQAKVVL